MTERRRDPTEVTVDSCLTGGDRRGSLSERDDQPAPLWEEATLGFRPRRTRRVSHGPGSLDLPASLEQERYEHQESPF